MTVHVAIVERLKSAFREGGAPYSSLYLMRGIVDRVRDRMDRRLAAIERTKRLVGPWTISARRFTAHDNRALWNSYDWSRRGEEWSKSSEWKDGVVRDLLLPNVPAQTRVLEVGPGGGRWTEILQRHCSHVVLVDVSERALAICRERFADCQNVEYVLNDGDDELPIDDASFDAIWSYDVFVHINPLDARQYIREFHRLLKPGGTAVVHHPGAAASADRDRRWRSDLTDEMVAEFCRESGLRLRAQTRQYVNDGDVVSFIDKPE